VEDSNGAEALGDSVSLIDADSYSELRNKVKFDTNPTNPQADIIATGRCEFWVMDIDLVKPIPEKHPSPPTPSLNRPTIPYNNHPTSDTT